MPTKPSRRSDPAAALRRLRSRVLGGARPALDSLSAEDMAAAKEMILNGEAIVDYAACRLFLSAKPSDGQTRD